MILNCLSLSNRLMVRLDELNQYPFLAPILGP